MSEINTCPRTGLPHSYWPQGNCQYCGEVSPVLASTREERDRMREACSCALGHLTGNMDGDIELGDPVELLRAALNPVEESK